MIIQTKDSRKKHFYVILAKRLLRMVAGGFIMTGNFFVAGALFITAETLGVLEEMI
jgi:hypothetical protein